MAKRYKRLAIKMHPDKSKEEDAVDKFQKLVTSYQTINDPEKRASYMDLYRLRCYMSQKPLEDEQSLLLPHYVFVVDKSKHKHGKKSVRRAARRSQQACPRAHPVLTRLRARRHACCCSTCSSAR